ncbi:unnamed protein product [Periconia digitata]|uniref:Nudix hydrolase domain-containing protein n=1 Tax=Periconia digitata TaxID=1303443 RepID=A0A9W4UP23_9PLEO|nr:unnamed protein product [Periconia digitata]
MLKRCNDADDVGSSHLHQQSSESASPTTHPIKHPMNTSTCHLLARHTFRLHCARPDVFKFTNCLHIRPFHAYPRRLAAYNMPSSPKITSVDALPANEAKWLEFQKITWSDQTGKSRIWESASRKTRGKSGVDAVAISTIIRHPSRPASTIVILQYRPPVDAVCVEFPAGLVDESEKPGDAALRELMEETGYKGRLKFVSPTIVSDPGMSTANMQLATVEVELGEDEKEPEQQLEDGEFIERVVVPLDELYERLQKYSEEGKMVDARLWHWAAGEFLSLPLGLPCLGRAHGRSDLLIEKCRPLIRIRPIAQMSRKNKKSASAHRIPRSANNLRLGLVEARNLRIILRVLRVAVQNHTRDATLDVGGQLLNGAVVDGCALRVAAGHDDGIGTLRGHGRNGVNHEVSGLRVGAAGERVGGERSVVVDAFGCDVGVAELLLDTVRGRWAYYGSLHRGLLLAAKAKRISLQPP